MKQSEEQFERKTSWSSEVAIDIVFDIIRIGLKSGKVALSATHLMTIHSKQDAAAFVLSSLSNQQWSPGGGTCYTPPDQPEWAVYYVYLPSSTADRGLSTTYPVL